MERAVGPKGFFLWGTWGVAPGWDEPGRWPSAPRPFGCAFRAREAADVLVRDAPVKESCGVRDQWAGSAGSRPRRFRKGVMSGSLPVKVRYIFIGSSLPPRERTMLRKRSP